MNSEQLEEIKHHFSVVSEALRSDIRRITEGHTTEFKEIQAIQHSHNLEIDLSDLMNRIDHLETSQA